MEEELLKILKEIETSCENSEGNCIKSSDYYSVVYKIKEYICENFC